MVTVVVEQYRCAYCRQIIPADRVASGPWDWPGRGRVVNCVGCCYTDGDLANLIEPHLPRDPMPFVQLVKRVRRRQHLQFTEREIQRALRELSSEDRARLISGQGWSR